MLAADLIRKMNIDYEPSPDEVMQVLTENDKMTLEDAVFSMKKNEIEKILTKHPYMVRKENDGRWATYIKDPNKKNGRKRIVKPTEEMLYSYLYDYYKELDEEAVRRKMTLKDIYPLWIEYKSLRVSTKVTIDRIDRDWKKYYSKSEIVNIPMRKLNKVILDDWAHEMVSKYNLSSKQYFNMAVIMRQALDYAVEYGYIEENLFRKIRIEPRLFRVVRKKDSDLQVFLEDVYKDFKEYALFCFQNHSHNQQPLTPLAVLFMLQTGLRVGELRALKYDDITDNGSSIEITKFIRIETGEVVRHTKGSYGDRKVPLNDEAIHIIEMTREEKKRRNIPLNEYIFSMNDTPIGYSAVNRAFWKYCDAIGTPRKSTHSARKSFVSALFDGDMNPDGIRRIVGHTDLRTTYNNYCYDRRTDETNRKILNNVL